jgi:hypothetical protein
MTDTSTLYIAVGLIDPNSKSVALELKRELDVRRDFSKTLKGILLTNCLQNDTLAFGFNVFSNPYQVNTDILQNEMEPFGQLLLPTLSKDCKVPDDFITKVEEYRKNCIAFADSVFPYMAEDREVIELGKLLDSSPIDLFIVKGNLPGNRDAGELAFKLASFYKKQKQANDLIVALDCPFYGKF